MTKNYSLKILSLLFYSLFTSANLLAQQIPAGYYDPADGKTAYELKTELSFIIDDHTNRGYSALWNLYSVADERADGFVWDIYSDCDLVFGTDQDNGSGGTTACDKYNREHTFPQSWFNSASTPRADGHMVLPTDKKMNSERGNLPYGKTNGSEVISGAANNGTRKGSSSISGYSGTVFEPADEYKGDLARIYFYMATRYEVDIDAWETNSSEANAVLNGSNDQVYEDWALNMLIDWHKNDPVSEKEINRNEAVYDFQGNRNPFVDHPEWVTCIWQNSCDGNANPTIEGNVSNLSYGDFLYGSTAVTKSFSLNGSDLTTSISLTSNSEDFLLSTNQNGSFSQALSLEPTAEGNVQQTIYVRLEPIDNIDEVLSATITITQSEVDPIQISLSATIEQLPNTEYTLNFLIDTLFARVETPIYEIVIQANKKVEEPVVIDLKLAGFTDIFYPAQFTTAPEGQGTGVALTMNSGDSIAKLTITLDTAQLKTAPEKSFLVNLLNNGNYLVGEKENILFKLAGFEPIVTANMISRTKTIALKANPVTEIVTLTEQLNDATYIIYNDVGQAVLSGKDDQLVQLEVGSLQPGLYWLIVRLDNKEKTYIAKFIKK